MPRIKKSLPFFENGFKKGFFKVIINFYNYLKDNRRRELCNLDNLHRRAFDKYRNYHRWQSIAKSQLQSNLKKKKKLIRKSCIEKS